KMERSEHENRLETSMNYLFLL
ncbi:hypothetical protein F2P56_037249, partial (mitochondrion) [Juglans regia]